MSERTRSHTHAVFQASKGRNNEEKMGTDMSADLGLLREPEGGQTLEKTPSLRWHVLSVARMMTAQGEGDARRVGVLHLPLSPVCVSFCACIFFCVRFSSTRLMITITLIFSQLTVAQQNATLATWAGFLLLHKKAFTVCVCWSWIFSTVAQF